MLRTASVRGLALATCLGSLVASSVTAQERAPQRAQPARAATMTQVDPPSLQAQLRDGATRSKLAAELKGISVDEVLEVAARVERAPADAASRERREARESAGDAVGKAQLATLARMAATSRVALRPKASCPRRARRSSPGRPALRPREEPSSPPRPVPRST